MGLGSIVRLSWDLISMSTATDYLVSISTQLRFSCCATSACSACKAHRPDADSPHNQNVVLMFQSFVCSSSYGQLQLSSNWDILACLQDHTGLLCNLLAHLRCQSTYLLRADYNCVNSARPLLIVMILSGHKCHVTNQRMSCPGASCCWSDFWRGAVGCSRGHFGPSQGHPTPVHAVHCHQR